MSFLEKIKETARETIKIESLAIKKLIQYIDDDFAHAVELIYNCRGRVIITGIGKSANISQKIVASLNSTGTPSIFMHAADAIHGDLGIVLKDDIVICISKSGNTPEIKVLVPLIKNLGTKLIAMVSNVNSFLAKKSDFILRATVEKEACPNNLAPTSSTTAQLVIGDALTVALLKLRGFTQEDFAKFHPGGSLGKKLYMRVSDLYINNDAPKVFLNDKIKTIILEISEKRLGATVVLDEKNNICGIITDGDLRRMLEKNNILENITANDIMSINYKSIFKEELAVNSFHLMKKNNITQLIVIDEKNKYLGILHLHDILKEGII